MKNVIPLSDIATQYMNQFRIVILFLILQIRIKNLILILFVLPR